MAEWKKGAGKILALLRRFVVSEQSMIAETCLAALFFLLHIEVAGLVVFVYLIALKLVISEDSLCTFLPFLLIGLFVLRQYNSYDTFMALKFVMGVPAVFGVLFHFLFYRVKPEKGGLFRGYLALAIALALGGMFSISLKDYLSGTSLYYTYGLGFGLFALYTILLPRLNPNKAYDIRNYVAKTAFYCGVFCLYIIAVYYLGNLDLMKSGANVVVQGSGATISLFANNLNSISNNLSTTVLLTMPFVFYLARQKGVMGGVYFAVGVLEGVAAVLTLSRGGMIFASGMCLFLAVYTLVRYKAPRARNLIVLGGIIVVLGTIALIFRKDFKELFSQGVVPSELIMKLALCGVSLATALFSGYLFYLFTRKQKRTIYIHVSVLAALALVCVAVAAWKWDTVREIAVRLDYYRGNMLAIAVENFKTFPIFGTGMGYQGLQGIYAHRKGMFGCYHCLPVQVVGSLGLVGVAAYLYMLRERIFVLRNAKDKEYAAVVLFSYLGLLYMSLVNPGIFCPVVYGLQLAVYFISAEKSEENEMAVSAMN